MAMDPTWGTGETLDRAANGNGRDNFASTAADWRRYRGNTLFTFSNRLRPATTTDCRKISCGEACALKAAM